jgi:predicted secreted Zn-dependent protease
LAQFHDKYVLMMFFICAALAFASGDANARLRTTEKTKYFNVDGNTTADLRKSLRRAHPDFYAETQWHAVTNYAWKPFGKTCRMTKVDVSLELVVLLPRRQTGPRLSPEVQKKWDDFVAAIIVHENGHVKLYKAAARDLDKSLRAVSRPCRTIGRHADAVNEDGFKRMQKVNDDYDTRTNGGEKQGVTLY